MIEPDPTNAELQPGIRPAPLRRAVAFLIDLSLATLFYNVVDDLVMFPVPRLVMNLVLVAVFVGYHSWTWTPGRGLLDVGLVTLDGRTPVPRPRLSRRALVLGLLVLLDWTLVAETVSGGQAPLVVGVVLEAVRWSMILVSVVLALVDPLGQTIHDRLAATRLVRGQGAVAPGSRRSVPRLVVVVTAVLCFGLAAVTNLALSRAVGEPLVSARWMRPMSEPDAMARWAEQTVADELGLRCSVAWNQTVVTGGAHRGETSLGVGIDFPLLAWFSDRREQVLPVLLSRLEVKGRPPTRAEMRLCGGFLIFRWSHTNPFDADVIRESKLLVALAGDPEATRLHDEVERHRTGDGRPSPQLAESMIILGNHFLENGHAALARHYCQRGHDTMLAAVGEGHRLMAQTHYNLGYYHSSVGNYAVADSLFDLAEAVLDTTAPGDRTPLIALYIAANRAQDQHAQGHFDQARRQYLDTIALADAAGPPGQVFAVKQLINLAAMERHLGDEVQARTWLAQARQRCDESDGLPADVLAAVETMSRQGP